MEVYKYEVRDSTRLAYSLVYEKHVGPALGKYKLSDITTVAVRKFLNSMKSAGYSFEMRNKARIIILDLFDKAIMDDFAFKNPARGIKLKRDDKEYSAKKSRLISSMRVRELSTMSCSR